MGARQGGSQGGGQGDGQGDSQGDSQGRGAAVGSWREAFLRAPYLRDVFIAIGVLSETFETAITWERFPAFHDRVTGAVRSALGDVCGGRHGHTLNPGVLIDP